MSARSGGFLYISTFHVAPEFRKDGSTDVGAAAIGAFLCQPDLMQRWTVAAYIADSREWLTPEERDEERDSDRALSYILAPPVARDIGPTTQQYYVRFCSKVTKRESKPLRLRETGRTAGP